MSAEDRRSSELLRALETELAGEPSDYRFTAAELSMIDHIHTRGYAATVELADAVGVTSDMHVLDLGSGFGGPARYLAEQFGCRVEGIDVTAGIVSAADYLSSRWIGPKDCVRFAVGDAASLPFPDASFDLVWMQHVAMNVADRRGLYREVRRVLRAGGRFATYDVLRSGEELIYPTPWAADERLSTVLTADETRNAIEDAGLRIVSFELDTAAAIEWVRKTASTFPSGQRRPGASIMRAALGDNFGEILGNLGRNYLERRADVATIIAERAD